MGRARFPRRLADRSPQRPHAAAARSRVRQSRLPDRRGVRRSATRKCRRWPSATRTRTRRARWASATGPKSPTPTAAPAGSPRRRTGGCRPTREEGKRLSSADALELGGAASRSTRTTDFDSWDRCITRGLPASMFPFMYNNGMRIFQAPGAGRAADGDGARDAHHPDRRPRRDLRTRSTTGWAKAAGTGKTATRWWSRRATSSPAPRPPTSAPPARRRTNDTPVERAGKDGRAVHDDRTARRSSTNSRWTDPVVFTEPWSARLEWQRDDDFGIFEYACHEGNVQIRNFITASRAERTRINRTRRGRNESLEVHPQSRRGRIARRYDRALASYPAIAQQVRRRPDHGDAAGADRPTSRRRPSWGDPDLRGTWPIDNIASLPMNRPASVQRPRLVDRGGIRPPPAAGELVRRRLMRAKTRTAPSAWVTGSSPTPRAAAPTLLVDPPSGQLPPLTPQADGAAEGRPLELDAEHAATTGSPTSTHGTAASAAASRPRCCRSATTTASASTSRRATSSIALEMLGTRVIPIRSGNDPQHWPKPVEAWLGNSVGHWEGNTLVIETTNIKTGDSATQRHVRPQRLAAQHGDDGRAAVQHDPDQRQGQGRRAARPRPARIRSSTR